MKPKFTPGPWKVGEWDENSLGHEIVSDSRFTLPIYVAKTFAGLCDGEEAANAALIAAATRMYEALDRIHSLMKCLNINPDGEAMKQARAALAAARGEKDGD